LQVRVDADENSTRKVTSSEIVRIWCWMWLMMPSHGMHDATQRGSGWSKIAGCAGEA
jgi:hypothetical protein